MPVHNHLINMNSKQTVREVISTLRNKRCGRLTLEHPEPCNKPAIGYVRFYPYGRKRPRCADCCKDYDQTDVTYYDDDT